MPRPHPTDDDVLRWWEAYDNGLSVEEIARREERHVLTVRNHLEDLGAFEDKPEVHAKADPQTLEQLALDRLLKRMAAGELEDDERAIMDALARINHDAGDLDAPSHVRFARSMEHVKPGARGPVVQSARQRGNESGLGIWRKVVRRDLKQSGLMP